MIAAFGVPPLAHEDDPVRGVKAALEIYTNLSAQNMENSIGVTSGKVFCGSVGSDVRQEYAMVGDIVNLSARLMVVAGKEKYGVLCDSVTFEAIDGKIEFEQMPAVMVKGEKLVFFIIL